MDKSNFQKELEFTLTTLNKTKIIDSKENEILKNYDLIYSILFDLIKSSNNSTEKMNYEEMYKNTLKDEFNKKIEEE